MAAKVPVPVEVQLAECREELAAAVRDCSNVSRRLGLAEGELRMARLRLQMEGALALLAAADVIAQGPNYRHRQAWFAWWLRARVESMAPEGITPAAWVSMLRPGRES